MIVINNRSATAELIFHQGLLLGSRRNGRESREEKRSLASRCAEDCLGKSSPPPKASCPFPLHLFPQNFRAIAKTYLWHFDAVSRHGDLGMLRKP